MNNFTVPLGSEVKSNVTGFAGVVVSRSEHLNGCNRYWIQPKTGKDGKFVEGIWVDEVELEVTKEPVLKKTNPERGGFASRIR